MKIHFDEIADSGLTLDIKEYTWFPANFPFAGEPFCQVTVKKANGKVILQGTITAEISTECDRCLESNQITLDASFEIYLEYVAAGDPYLQVKEHVCNAAEMDVVFVSEPAIDLFSILRQQVILAMPSKNLCREECRGLCYSCGKNLNDGVCNCSTGTNVLPFGVLGKLKDS